MLTIPAAKANKGSPDLREVIESVIKYACTNNGSQRLGRSDKDTTIITLDPTFGANRITLHDIKTMDFATTITNPKSD